MTTSPPPPGARPSDTALLEIALLDGGTVRLRQELQDGAAHGRGLWTAALLLADFICEHPAAFSGKRTVLEIGSGVGLGGLAVGLARSVRPPPAALFLADFEAGTLANLAHNVALNEARTAARCRCCRWTGTTPARRRRTSLGHRWT